MMSDASLYAVKVDRHPLLRLLVSFPIACFCCALATDLAYVWTANMMWADFSTWLLAAAMAFGVLAALVGLGTAFVHRREPGRRFSWPMAIGGLVVLVLGMFDNLVHSRDAWTSVVPSGLALSAAIVVVILVTNWIGSPRPLRAAVRTGDAVTYSGARR